MGIYRSGVCSCLEKKAREERSEAYGDMKKLKET